MDCKNCKTRIDPAKLACAECAQRNSEKEMFSRLNRGEMRIFAIPDTERKHLAVTRNCATLCRTDITARNKSTLVDLQEIGEAGLKGQICQGCLAAIHQLRELVAH